MNLGRWLLRCVAIAAVFAAALPIDRPSLAGGEIAPTRPRLFAPQQGTSELEDSLFVQDPHLPNGKKGVQVIWIPQSIQKYCLGKTTKECINIDYCIRTTNKQAATCRNLGVDTTHLPAYPPDVPPRRVLSIVFFFPMATDRGFANLAKFFANSPKDSLNRLSRSARIKAKIKLTRTADDDQFDLREVLDAPST